MYYTRDGFANVLYRLDVINQDFYELVDTDIFKKDRVYPMSLNFKSTFNAKAFKVAGWNPVSQGKLFKIIVENNLDPATKEAEEFIIEAIKYCLT